MATVSPDTEFLDNFQTCAFCHEEMSVLSNPQLTTCFHSVCFKCANDKKSYCWTCQQPVKTIGNNLVLTTVMKEHAGENTSLSPEECINDDDFSDFGELATKIDELTIGVQKELDKLDELKIRLKAQAVLETTRSHESMREQIEESRLKTMTDLKKEASRHFKKLDIFVRKNEEERQRQEKKVIIAKQLTADKSFIIQHPGLINPLQHSKFFSNSTAMFTPLTKFVINLDLRFGMLMSISFLDSYKILAKIIPEEVIEKCYCQKLKIGVPDFRAFVTHSKNIDKNVLPSPPVMPEKRFSFIDFNPEQCVDMIATLLSLGEKVRERESDCVTHIICSNPLASQEIMKVLFSGGWMLKSTFITTAKVLKKLPHEYDHEWSTLKIGDSIFNPKTCREAIHRRGKPFSKLVMVVCTDNPRDSELLRAGGAETVDSRIVVAHNAVNTLIRSGKNRNQILVVWNCRTNHENVLRKVSKAVKVPIFTLENIIELTLRGWFDRINPLFTVRHYYNQARPVS